MVSEDQDYTAHFADPDTLVNWDFVEQVVSSSAKFLSYLWVREQKGTVVTKQLLSVFTADCFPFLPGLMVGIPRGQSLVLPGVYFVINWHWPQGWNVEVSDPKVYKQICLPALSSGK